MPDDSVNAIGRKLAGGEQLEALREFISMRLAPMQLSTDDVGTFQAQARSTTLGVVELADMKANNAFVARRTNKLITSTSSGHLKVSLQLAGASVVSQCNREVALAPGDFVLYDTALPYQVSAQACSRMLTVMFSPVPVRLSQPQLQSLIARQISGREGLGRILARHLAELARQKLGVEMSPGSCHLADATLDLLAAVFAQALAQSGAPELSDGKAGLLLRVREHIEHHLHDSDLDVTSIAAAHYVSVRTLHKLFQDEDQTVAAWIRFRRIERCRRDLANPTLAGQSVSSIAASWGLTDHAGFSRLFKATHGLCPRDYRAWALSRGNHVVNSPLHGPIAVWDACRSTTGTPPPRRR